MSFKIVNTLEKLIVDLRTQNSLNLDFSVEGEDFTNFKRDTIFAGILLPFEKYTVPSKKGKSEKAYNKVVLESFKKSGAS